MKQIITYPFICPKCAEPLAKEGNSYVCSNRHCFDIAKSGYVNLLSVSQKNSLTPGDNNEMILARANMMKHGYYNQLATAIIEELTPFNPTTIADVGCGEGYILQRLNQAFNAKEVNISGLSSKIFNATSNTPSTSNNTQNNITSNIQNTTNSTQSNRTNSTQNSITSNTTDNTHSTTDSAQNNITNSTQSATANTHSTTGNTQNSVAYNVDCQFSNVKMVGTDISKFAINEACKQYKNLPFAVASSAKLPYKSESISAVICAFAPLFKEEVARVLTKNGVLARVIPDEYHLFNLKKQLYTSPYANVIDEEKLEGFAILATKKIKYNLNLQEDNIADLIKMTPYYYNTKKEDIQRLCNQANLTANLEFILRVYQKI